MNDLTPSEKALYKAIIHFTPQYICDASRDAIATHAGYADHGSCSRLFKSLRAKGYINYTEGVRNNIQVLK